MLVGGNPTMGLDGVPHDDHMGPVLPISPGGQGRHHQEQTAARAQGQKDDVSITTPVRLLSGSNSGPYAVTGGHIPYLCQCALARRLDSAHSASRNTQNVAINLTQFTDYMI